MSEDRNSLWVARELYGRVVYTHKTHEKEREAWSHKANIMKWISVVSAGLTTLSVIFTNIRILGILLGTLTTVFLIYQLSFRPDEQAALHRIGAKKLLSIRERLLLLIGNMMGEKNGDQFTDSSLEHIVNELTLVCEFLPDTSKEAYGQAGYGLKNCEEMTFSSHEIDMLLPEQLRLKSEEANEG